MTTTSADVRAPAWAHALRAELCGDLVLPGEPGYDQADAVRAHLARVADVLGPLASGENYLNFLDLDAATPDRIRSAYSSADLGRLVRIKAVHDPGNVFRFNRNITVPDRTDQR